MEGVHKGQHLNSEDINMRGARRIIRWKKQHFAHTLKKSINTQEKQRNLNTSLSGKIEN